MTKPLKSLGIDRTAIGARLRELREKRLLTQAELAQQLGIPQSRLSEIERGRRSLTAEQFLGVLGLFNVPASEFSATPTAPSATIQNTLARLGARHLIETPDVVPSASNLTDVIREALADGSPRWLTGLAPVLVHQVDQINLQHLYVRLTDVGLERRLGWVLENTLFGIREELASSPPRPWTKQYLRAETILQPFLDFLIAKRSSTSGSQDDILDVIDRDIRTPQTRDSVLEGASPSSKRWRISTRLQPHDFAHALTEARTNG